MWRKPTPPHRRSPGSCAPKEGSPPAHPSRGRGGGGWPVGARAVVAGGAAGAAGAAGDGGPPARRAVAAVGVPAMPWPPWHLLGDSRSRSALTCIHAIKNCLIPDPTLPPTHDWLEPASKQPRDYGLKAMQSLSLPPLTTCLPPFPRRSVTFPPPCP